MAERVEPGEYLAQDIQMIRNVVLIDGGRIVDWSSFHAVFAEGMGFPEFYGRNMDAWIDCMTYVETL